MPVQRKIPYAEGIYFITFTCYRWLPLIAQTNGYDIVYRWFDHLKQQGHLIAGYVIMPNHIHVLIAFVNNGKSINREVGEGKRFIAYAIVKRLKELLRLDTLAQLQQGVEGSDRQRGKLHAVWEPSFDWKECKSRQLMEQKLDYMHNNPCQGKWSLVPVPASYLHSSAAYYYLEKTTGYPVFDFARLEDVDLTNGSGH